jgi:hypothetical protein
VLPVCLFLKVGLNGLGWDAHEERLWDRVVLRFEFAYMGLPALDGLAYFNGASLLGLALSALMKLPGADRARVKAEGLSRLARGAENPARRELLAEYFNNYRELPPSDVSEFEKLIAQEPKEIKDMVSSFEISGRLKEKREIVRKLLDKKFGPLPEGVQQRLWLLSGERLDEIVLAVLDATSLKELGLTDE